MDKCLEFHPSHTSGNRQEVTSFLILQSDHHSFAPPTQLALTHSIYPYQKVGTMVPRFTFVVFTLALSVLAAPVPNNEVSGYSQTCLVAKLTFI